MEQTSFTHFLYCPFTGLGLRNGYRGDEWLRQRIRIFKSFTLPSILNQSNLGNFYLWVSWRPEDRDNPIVREFQEFTESFRGLDVVHTFGGLCFWDDKYLPAEAGNRLSTHLRRSLRELKDHVGDFEMVLMTIQPSDDMYNMGAMQRIQQMALKQWSEGKRKFALGWKNGYIMNYATKEIAEYITNTTPPFFTIAFPANVFLDYEKHYYHTGPYVSHEHIGEHMEYIEMRGRAFCVGTHGANISTTFNHIYKGRTLLDNERDSALCAFGVYFSDPVVISPRPGIVARKILNKLPFEPTIRSLYHSLPTWLQKL